MVAEVIVDISTSEIDRVFDYDTNGLQVHIGHRVLVPFGKKLIEGFVIRLKETSTFKGKLKPINKIIDKYQVITPEMLELMDYMTYKYNLRKIDVLRLFIPSKLRGGKVKELVKNYITLNPNIDYDSMIQSLSSRAIKQKQCLEYLYSNGGEFQSKLNNEFSASAVNTLVIRNYLVVEAVKVIENQILQKVKMTKKY